MNEFRRTGRAAQWVIRELGLPALVKACVSCRSLRHHPTGKFRVNANGKLLDVWMLIHCERCGRTAKIPVHERTPVQALGRERLRMFETNDPVMARELAMDAGLARSSGYQLDWSGTWQLETGLPAGELERAYPALLTVAISFELPVPIRVEKLLTTGFGLSRAAVRGLVYSGRIRLPMAIDAKARDDFTFTVVTAAPPSRDPAGSAHRVGRRTHEGRLVRVPRGRRRRVLLRNRPCWQGRRGRRGGSGAGGRPPLDHLAIVGSGRTPARRRHGAHPAR
jgi:hypothetical protein